MCGRVNIHDSQVVKIIMERVGLPHFPEQEARYNICPTEQLDVITQDNIMDHQLWSIEFGRFRHPNTKVSTLKKRRDLQKLLLDSRCVVPLNGFYEWPDVKERPKYKGIKTRFYISNPDHVIFLAGISKPKGEGMSQFNILTTEPNPLINDFHHRMPVWLSVDEVNRYLHSNDLGELYEMMAPSDKEITIFECHSYVNNGRNDGPQCMEQLKSWDEFQQQF